MDGAVGIRKVAIKAEVLDDISSRFLINLSSEERADPIKLCSHIEVAHWYYLDLMRPEDHSLPACNLKEFMATVFQHCPWLVRGAADSSKDLEKLFTDWKAHKYSKPVRGAILLNQDWTKCLLVQGYPSGTSWTFPKGKLEEDETDKDAAVREVFEETGFDIRVLIQKSYHLDAVIHDSNARMYIIPGVPETTHFEAKTRKEIKSIKWFEIKDLPSYKKDQKALGGKTSHFFMVIPFIGQLRRWIQKRKGRTISASFKIQSQAHDQLPPGSGRHVENTDVHAQSTFSSGQLPSNRNTAAGIPSAMSMPLLSVGQVTSIPTYGNAGPQQSYSTTGLLQQQQHVPLTGIPSMSHHAQPNLVTPHQLDNSAAGILLSNDPSMRRPTPLLNTPSRPQLANPLSNPQQYGLRTSLPSSGPLPTNFSQQPALRGSLPDHSVNLQQQQQQQQPGLKGVLPNSCPPSHNPSMRANIIGIGPPVNLQQQQQTLRPHPAFQQQPQLQQALRPHPGFQQQPVASPLQPGFQHQQPMAPPQQPDFQQQHPMAPFQQPSFHQQQPVASQQPGFQQQQPVASQQPGFQQRQALGSPQPAFQQQQPMPSPQQPDFQQQQMASTHSHHSVLLPPNPVLQSGPGTNPFISTSHQFQPLPPARSIGQQNVLSTGVRVQQTPPLRALLPTPHSAQSNPALHPTQGAYNHNTQGAYNHNSPSQVERLDQVIQQPAQHQIQKHQQMTTVGKVPLLPLPSSASADPHPRHPLHQPAVQMQKIPLLPSPPQGCLFRGQGQRSDMAFSLKPVPNFVNFKFDRQDILKNLRT